MSPDGSEAPHSPMASISDSKPRTYRLLKFALISSAVCLLCSIVVIVAFYPPFMLSVNLAFILFNIAIYAGVISIPLYIAATVCTSGFLRRLLVFGLGTLSFFILIGFGAVAGNIFHDNQYIAYCESNLLQLKAALYQYSQTSDGLLLDPNWCDTLLAKHNILPETLLCITALPIPGQSIFDYDDRNKSGYALNKQLLGQKLITANPDTVLVFETYRGWNQIGDFNSLSLNHRTLKHGNGCNILFVNGKIRFVTKDKIPGLRWKP